jgi:thioredoxin 1
MFRTGLLFLILLMAAVGCSEGQKAPSLVTPPAASKAVQSTGHHLVFFLDPQGGPCIMQDQILSGMAEDFRGKVTIKYVSTRVPDDRQLFSVYGVRALPTLLLADAAGREIRRLAPGVKSAAEIRSLIQAIQ